MPKPNLTDERRQLFTEVLDQFIPPSRDGTKPGAGQLGCGEQLEAAMADDAMFAAIVTGGLDKLAQLIGDQTFAQLDPSARDDLLREVDASVGGFTPSLSFRVYSLYYQDNRILEALDLAPRPPHPIGYEMEPFDESLLDPVRRRAKLYREV